MFGNDYLLLGANLLKAFSFFILYMYEYIRDL